jgi:hypothetical protein
MILSFSLRIGTDPGAQYLSQAADRVRRPQVPGKRKAWRSTPGGHASLIMHSGVRQKD